MVVGTVYLVAGRGLSLRPLADTDAEELHELWTSAGVRRFLWDDEVVPFERTRAIINTSKRLFTERGFGLWSVRHANDPRLIGVGGLWHFREPPELELLFAIAENAWGRGYATEVGRAVADYGFCTLRMSVIRASTDAANARSVRVLDKLGFRVVARSTVAGLDTLFYERRAAASSARDLAGERS
jgi:ribosomal-protein-alanine N-acetyltransferase